MSEGIAIDPQVGDVYREPGGCELRVTAKMEGICDGDGNALEGWSYLVRPLNGPEWGRDEVWAFGPIHGVIVGGK